MNPRQEKIDLKRKILAVLKRDMSASRDVLTSSLKLESGFSDKVVSELFDDMVKVGLIAVKDNSVTITKLGENYGEEQ